MNSLSICTSENPEVFYGIQFEVNYAEQIACVKFLYLKFGAEFMPKSKSFCLKTFRLEIPNQNVKYLKIIFIILDNFHEAAYNVITN